MPNQKQTWALLSATSGGVAPGPAPFPNTYSLDFSIDDYLDTNYIPPTALYSSGFSLSAWINPSSTTDETIIGQYSGGNRFYWRLYGSFYWVGFGSWNDWTTISSSVITGVWQSVILTYNPSDTTIRIYLDGVLDDSMVKDLSSFGVPDSSLNIGATNATGYFSGNIDEVSIYSATLSAAQVLSLYNSGTPTDLSSFEVAPVAWYRCGDSSKALYFNSIWQIPNEMKVGNWSHLAMDFDGVDDYVGFGVSTFSSGDTISMSLWVNKSASNGVPVCWGNNVQADTILLWFDVDELVISWGQSAASSIRLDYTFNNGTWYHICITGTIYSGFPTAYINGSVASTKTLGGWLSAFQLSARFGGLVSHTTFDFTGKLDDVSIFNTTLTQSQVNTVFNSGVPSDISEMAGLVGFWRMGEGSTWDGSNWTIPDDSTNSNNGTSANMGIEDRVTDAPDNTSQANSVNMEEADRVEDTP